MNCGERSRVQRFGIGQQRRKAGKHEMTANGGSVNASPFSLLRLVGKSSQTGIGKRFPQQPQRIIEVLPMREVCLFGQVQQGESSGRNEKAV